MMEKSRFDQIIKELEAIIVDEKKIVTYKFLSRVFNVNTNTAKQLLHSYATTHSTDNGIISCVYQVSGRKHDGSYYTTILNESDLDSARELFSDVFSESIYSILPSKPLEDLQILYAIDKLEDTCSMNFRVITCSKCVPKANHEIVQPPLKLKQEEVKKPEKKREAAKEEFPKKQEELPKPKKTTISSMFSAQNQKPKALEKVEKIEVVQNKKEKKRKSKASCENTSNESKRRRIKVFSSSEDEEMQVEPVKERSPSPELFPEAIDINEPEETDTHKRKKRKIVDKTVMTDEGYIETVKEVVYETDSDQEQATAQKTETKKISPKKPVQKKSPNSPKKGKQKASTDGRKQSSLLTFFKKS